jgi:hypothetical protein
MAGFPVGETISGESKQEDLGTSSSESELDVLSANSNDGDNGGNCMKTTRCISYILVVLGWFSFILSLISTERVLTDLGFLSEPLSDVFSNNTLCLVACSLFALIARTLP